MSKETEVPVKREPVVHLNGGLSNDQYLSQAKNIPLLPSEIPEDCQRYEDLSDAGKAYVGNVKRYFSDKETWIRSNLMKDGDWVVLKTGKNPACFSDVFEALRTTSWGDVLICVNSEFDEEHQGVLQFLGDDDEDEEVEGEIVQTDPSKNPPDRPYYMCNAQMSYVCQAGQRQQRNISAKFDTGATNCVAKTPVFDTWDPKPRVTRRSTSSSFQADIEIIPDPTQQRFQTFRKRNVNWKLRNPTGTTLSQSKFLIGFRGILEDETAIFVGPNSVNRTIPVGSGNVRVIPQGEKAVVKKYD